MASCGWLKGDNYSFNGMDDVNAKHTFLNSLPEPLGDETLRMMNLQRITLQQASLGEIYQHVLIALEKLCIPVFLMSDVKKLFNLIISFSLLYLVLCSIPHFHVVSYMLLVIHLINQFP